MTKADALSAKYRHEFVATIAGKQVKARVNGVCKTWKTRPDDFQLPMKHGLRHCFYIDETNAAAWTAA